MIRDQRETFIELATAALLVLVFLLYLSRLVPQSLALLLGGVILLGSGVYQVGKGWHVSLLTWVLGLILTLGGLGLRLFLVGVIRIDWLPVALLLVAALWLWNWWRKRGQR